MERQLPFVVRPQSLLAPSSSGFPSSPYPSVLCQIKNRNRIAEAVSHTILSRNASPFRAPKGPHFPRRNSEKSPSILFCSAPDGKSTDGAGERTSMKGVSLFPSLSLSTSPASHFSGRTDFRARSLKDFFQAKTARSRETAGKAEVEGEGRSKESETEATEKGDGEKGSAPKLKKAKAKKLSAEFSMRIAPESDSQNLIPVTLVNLEEEIMAAATAALEEVKQRAEAKILLLEAENRRLSERVKELEDALQEGKSTVVLPQEEGDVISLVESSTAQEEGVVDASTGHSASSIVWPSPSESPPFWERLPSGGKSEGLTKSLAKNVGAFGSGVESLEKDRQSLHVVHVTAEMAPIAKVGGLGDVVTGLGRACLSRGHRVEVMLPFYECLPQSEIEGLFHLRSYGSYFKGDWVAVQAYEGRISGVPVILLQPDNHFFRGGRIYGGSYNELEAYLFFSRAALEFMQASGAQPDIIHLHEWHASAVSLLYWDMYYQLGLQNPRLVLTIHNMEHHGECRWEQLDMCGLNGQEYATVEKAVDERTIGHNPERLSLLKGGIVYCNAVTTVSPTYSEETLCSGWLSNTLLKYRSKYSGILNGIDAELWNPETDPLLPANFSGSSLAGKAVCKHYLQRGLGLDLEIQGGGEKEEGGAGEKGNHGDANLKGLLREFEERRRAEEGKGARAGERIPLVVCVTRLVAQKGIHLIRHAIHRTKEKGGQFVLLGSAPDGRVQGEFEKLREEALAEGSVRILLTYSEGLAHLLFSAADIVLVPSMFEPCGLTQMLGMRYGAVPVVRRTGGLADTVFDIDDAKNDASRANGFVFDGIGEDALNTALDRALEYYKQKPDWWSKLSSHVISIDNSWNKAAKEYVNLYYTTRTLAG